MSESFDNPKKRRRVQHGDKVWTSDELTSLMQLFNDNYPITSISKQLQRSPRAVLFKLSKLKKGFASDSGSYTEVGLDKPSYELSFFLVGSSVGAIVTLGLQVFFKMLLKHHHTLPM
jgi:hypothetical protein